MEKQTITGYYDYYVDKYEYTNKNGSIIIDKPASDVVRFFSTKNRCPFCNTQLETVFVGTKTATLGNELVLNGEVFECPKCTWWMYNSKFSDSDDCFDSVHAVHTNSKYYGIAQSYDIKDKELPINVLNIELAKRPELVYKIHHRKLEELAQDILKGVYNCEVKHVGQTGDGGIDLIILDSDTPILVQVKQRQNPEHTELVKGVREFVGTLFIEDQRKGIYLSTAKKFSKGSTDVAKRMIDSRKLDYFELIDYDILERLILARPSEKIWKSLVQPYYESSGIARSVIFDTPEKIARHKVDCKNFLREFRNFIPHKKNL